MKKQALILCVITAVSCIAMILVDGILQPGYLIKSAIKLVFFLALPLLLAGKLGFSAAGFFRPDKKALLTGSLLGLATAAVIGIAYNLLGPYLDLSAVPASIEKGAGVTKDNFLFVGTYIAVCNSILEEFFFRGFAFLSLSRATSRTFASIFSSAAFAIYHAGMLITMVPPLLFVLALIALFLCGILFNLLDARQERIWPSWLVHMGANLAINAIGMHLLGML